MTADLPRRLLAELVGTFGFFFIGFTGIAALTTEGSSAIEAVGVAAGFGFGLAAMIFALGHISGGHYNPAVSAGLAAAKRFPIAEVPAYWAAQLVGGIAAAGATRAIFNETVLHATLTMPGHGVSNGQAFTREGALNLRNARFAEDAAPLEAGCPCPACRQFSRAYLHHVVKAGEIIAGMLLTWHNLVHYQRLMLSLRAAIATGTLPELVTQIAED